MFIVYCVVFITDCRTDYSTVTSLCHFCNRCNINDFLKMMMMMMMMIMMTWRLIFCNCTKIVQVNATTTGIS